MGLLVDGKWVDRWYDTKETGGKFVRQDASWRDWVTADGKPGDPAKAARENFQDLIWALINTKEFLFNH